MGLLERWGERKQRTAEWHNEVRRRNPNPRYGRTAGICITTLGVLGVARRVVVPVIGVGAWLALLVSLAVICFGIAIIQQKRRRREWEQSRSE